MEYKLFEQICDQYKLPRCLIKWIYLYYIPKYSFLKELKYLKFNTRIENLYYDDSEWRQMPVRFYNGYNWPLDTHYIYVRCSFYTAHTLKFYETIRNIFEGIKCIEKRVQVLQYLINIRGENDSDTESLINALSRFR